MRARLVPLIASSFGVADDGASLAASGAGAAVKKTARDCSVAAQLLRKGRSQQRLAGDAGGDEEEAPKAVAIGKQERVYEQDEIDIHAAIERAKSAADRSRKAAVRAVNASQLLQDIKKVLDPHDLIAVEEQTHQDVRRSALRR
eukprot:TRINITY_DN45055_c0_g1_i1.p1 TRINITY_DN45055_c0_g1~~TRINITY_DN45055_c0_g1_i1.p1  ORF type:complete len:144 (-),score=36.88 TRINITY_DN45055_c0_g1_i1:111-542(-)